MSTRWFVLFSLLLVEGVHSQQNSASASTKVTVSTTISGSTTSANAKSVTPSPSTPQPPPTTSHSSAAPTKSQSVVMTTSHMTSSSTNSPAPTSVPAKDFIQYQSQMMYIMIHNISITFNSPKYSTLTGASIDKMGRLNFTVDNPDSRYTFKSYYGTAKKPVFFISFDFKQNSDGGWILQDIQHARLDTNSVSAFQYEGVQYSVWAPAQLRYSCNNLTLHGTNGPVTTTMTLMVFSVQPFLHDGNVANVVFDCAGFSSNNHTIGLAIGLSLSLLVLVAAAVIIISLLVSRKFPNRGYNILQD